MAECG